MRYGYSVSFKNDRFGELIELTSENCDGADAKGLTFYMRHDPEKWDILWVDATIEEAYYRAIGNAETVVRLLEMAKRECLKPADVRSEMDSLTIDTPLADIKGLGE